MSVWKLFSKGFLLRVYVYVCAHTYCSSDKHVRWQRETFLPLHESCMRSELLIITKCSSSTPSLSLVSLPPSCLLFPLAHPPSVVGPFML